ncbi:MAG: helix-turn-helix domain-containing protein [Thermoplasmatota archaeon]
MRRAVIEIETNERYDGIMGEAFSHVEYYDIIENLKIDFRDGSKLQILNIRLKKGSSLEDVNLPKGCEILNLLERNGSVFTVLYRVKVPLENLPIFKSMNLDVVFDTPHVFRKDSLIITCIGKKDSLQKVFENITPVGSIRKVSISKAIFNEENVFSILTPRQKEVILTAKMEGYYDLPRKTDIESLAARMNISSSTFSEHLIRAENKIMKHLL